MATFPQYDYDGSDSELYRTNLYGGTDADLDNTAPVSATDGYTSDIDLTTQLGAVIDFLFDSSGTTDDLTLNLFKRRNSSWDGDELSINEIVVPSDGSEDIFHYTIDESYGPGHYRFSLQSSGATDTFDINIQMRTYRYENADT